MSAICCLVSAFCCLLSAVCCLLSAAFCLLSAVYCLLYVMGTGGASRVSLNTIHTHTYSRRHASRYAHTNTQRPHRHTNKDRRTHTHTHTHTHTITHAVRHPIMYMDKQKLARKANGDDPRRLDKYACVPYFCCAAYGFITVSRSTSTKPNRQHKPRPSRTGHNETASHEHVLAGTALSRSLRCTDLLGVLVCTSRDVLTILFLKCVPLRDHINLRA
jgi:hypothetical protein